MDAWIETTPEQEDRARRIQDAIDRECRLMQEYPRAWANDQDETARMLDALDVFLKPHRRRTEASGWKFGWYYDAFRRLGLLGDPNAPQRRIDPKDKKKSRPIKQDAWD